MVQQFHASPFPEALKRPNGAGRTWHVFCFITLGGAPHAEYDDSGFSAQVRPRSQRRLTPSFVVAALERARWLTPRTFFCCLLMACGQLFMAFGQPFQGDRAKRDPRRLAGAARRSKTASTAPYAMLQIDSCDFKSLAEVADVPRHPGSRS